MKQPSRQQTSPHLLHHKVEEHHASLWLTSCSSTFCRPPEEREETEEERRVSQLVQKREEKNSDGTPSSLLVGGASPKHLLDAKMFTLLFVGRGTEGLGLSWFQRAGGLLFKHPASRFAQEETCSSAAHGSITERPQRPRRRSSTRTAGGSARRRS